jgi:predicted ATPase
VLASSLVPGGVFIIDGFGSLHPSLAEMVAEWFAVAALKERTQIFISTQDLEFIERLLKSGGELVSLVRLYRIRDELAYEVLSCGEALEELDELRLDLRGP